MNKLYLILIILCLTALSHVMAIKCNFVKKPLPGAERMNAAGTLNFPHNSLNNNYRRYKRQNPVNPEAFDCEEVLPEDIDYNYVPMNVGSRYGFDTEIEEEDAACASTTKTLIPKELNNIYNQLIKVHQDQSLIQSIDITECTALKSDCSNGAYVSPNQRVICRQHYVKITLKAENEKKNTYNEQFYYPSACSCQTVTLKKKN